MERNSSILSLRFTVDRKFFSLFIPSLQRGIKLKVRVGCSLNVLFGDQLGLKPEYVKERIKTVFLDGKPVDDLDAAFIQDGSTVTLSAAMPGLAGATLRRGGFFAVLRSQITHGAEEMPVPETEGYIFLKLFNLLISEMGPAFLQRGFYMFREDFRGFLANLPDEFWRGCRQARAGGIELQVDQVRSLNGWDSDWVFLAVQFSP
jgi:hypothetical protein